MFGGVALQLIRLMGRRETVPSAIAPDDIPAALHKLREGVAIEDARLEAQDQDADEQRERPVSLHNRALPLIELLEAAHEEGVHVMWEEGGRNY